MSDSPDFGAGPGAAAVPRAIPRRPGLRVVLLGPRRGANVGAACRAIKNMGAGDLVVVGGDYDADEARRTAVHAADLFDARVEAATLEDAVACCRFVVGTTSRGNPWNIPVGDIDAVFDEARGRALDAGDLALVFGPEDRGLNNDELSRCHRAATIPTAGEYDSLNLAQAVVVCLYEWRRGGRASATRTAAPRPASREDGAAVAADAAAVAAALADLRLVLEEIGFLHGDQDERVMATVSSMLTRGGLDEREVRILRGLVRQVRWASRRGSGKQGG